ncbi:hypothetical protein J5N97_017249 [Dioscorea zingiberensis]|uniref:CCHC-type domain-containing protein n=1 Tax=Dioscorea zingiberensis TaxID=325984 RepID=A0A9D5CLR8_9LILI|nr:hypothetical protein J5N97_017249 [Dioscorea zingiberensis]
MDSGDFRRKGDFRRGGDNSYRHGGEDRREHRREEDGYRRDDRDSYRSEGGGYRCGGDDSWRDGREPRHDKENRREWKRKPSPTSLRSATRNIQDLREETQEGVGRNQRRRQLSYVNVLRGDTPEDRPLPPPAETQQDNEGWEKATRKKFRCISGEPRKEIAGKPTLQRRSPPTIRTPTGTIEVCGQCLRPGHKADECRREVTCRRCGGVGHKEVICKEVHRKILYTTTKNTTQDTKIQQKKPPAKGKKIDGEKPKEAPVKIPNQLPVTGKAKQTGERAGEYENHYISLAQDSNMIAGKEKMRRFSIAKITEARGVIVDGHKVEELLKGRINAQWNWDARILRDGRYIIECPSAVIARQIEKAGKMESPEFTLEFTPWTTALYRPAKAEGALRWVLVKNLPMCFRDLESIARMLKPVGDLVLIGERGAHDTEDFRAFIRIRRPRRLPSAIHCSVSTLQHTYIVELEEGQPELPWSPHRQSGEGKVGNLKGNKTPNQAGNDHQRMEKTLPSRPDKGKAPMESMHPPPVSIATDRGRGVIIRERNELERGDGQAAERQIQKKKIGDGRSTTPAPVTGGASTLNTEVTARHGRDAEVKGMGKNIPDKAASAAQQGREHSTVNGQLPEETEEFDFEATVMAMAAQQASTITTAAVDQINHEGQRETYPMSQVDPDMAHLVNETGPMKPPDPKELDVMILSMNEASPTTYPYIMAPTQPFNNIFKTVVGKIETDLREKTSLKLIANTWNLITDEAWRQITNGNVPTNNPMEPQQNMNKPGITEMESPQKTTKKPKLTQASIPKGRGRPKKTKPPEVHAVDTKPNNQTKKKRTYTRKCKRKEHPELEDDQLNLSSVPITLSDWPEEEIIARTIKVGIHLDQSGGNAKRILRHMRNTEITGKEGVQGSN